MHRPLVAALARLLAVSNEPVQEMFGHERLIQERVARVEVAHASAMLGDVIVPIFLGHCNRVNFSGPLFLLVGHEEYLTIFDRGRRGCCLFLGLKGGIFLTLTFVVLPPNDFFLIFI